MGKLATSPAFLILFITLNIIAIAVSLTDTTSVAVTEDTPVTPPPNTSAEPSICLVVRGFEPHYSGDVLQCNISTTEDYAEIPADTRALWLLYYPDRSIISEPLHPPLGDSLPVLDRLDFLVTDVTFLNEIDIHPGGFSITHLPNLVTYVITRDLQAPINEGAGFILVDYSFVGLDNLHELYLEGLALVEVQPRAFYGLDNLHELSLATNFLTTVAPNTFAPMFNLTALSLHDNYIENLPANVFAGLSNLARLDLSLNSFTRLTRGVFEHLENLELIDLSNNHIATLDEEVFSALNNLQHLDLNENSLMQIPTAIVFSLTSLTRLNLDNNLITLEPYLFVNLTSLQYLSLRHNRIAVLLDTHLKGLTSLTNLTLSDNQVTTITLGVFNDLTQLAHLDLSRNSIQGFEPEAFRSLTSLHELLLRDNQITWLPVDLLFPLNRLTTLELYNNPWICDCRIQWLIEWLRARFDSLEPSIQWDYIICDPDDPIGSESFYALIRQPHYLIDLCGEYNPATPNPTLPRELTSAQSDMELTTSLTDGTSHGTPIELTTKSDKPDNTESDALTATEKAILIGVILGGVTIVLLVVLVCVCVYRNRHKHQSWQATEQTPQHKIKHNGQSQPTGIVTQINFPSFYPDPDTSGGNGAWEMVDSFTEESSPLNQNEATKIEADNKPVTSNFSTTVPSNDHQPQHVMPTMMTSLGHRNQDAQANRTDQQIKTAKNINIQTAGHAFTEANSNKTPKNTNGLTSENSSGFKAGNTSEFIPENSSVSSPENSSGLTRENSAQDPEICDSLSREYRDRKNSALSEMSAYTVEGDYYGDGHHLRAHLSPAVTMTPTLSSPRADPLWKDSIPEKETEVTNDPN